MITISSKTILLKGSKVVSVKGSKRAKAHKRKVKGEKVVKDYKTIDKIVNKFEDSIKNQNFETCGIFDNDTGEMIFTQNGEKNYINITRANMRKGNGNIMTHNHPNEAGHSFSLSDIITDCTYKMKEGRIIHGDGSRYKMKYNFTKETSPFLTSHIKKEFEIQDKIVGDYLLNKVINKEISNKYAKDNHWDEVWKRVSNNISELEYIGSVIND